jgi:hypothetical protein
MDFTMSEAVAANIYQAVKHLARAAASAEMRDEPKIGAEVLWYQARSLCHEYALDYELIVDGARRYAQGVLENRINII